MTEQKKVSLETLQRWVDQWVKNCNRNKKDPADVEVIVKNDRNEYRPFCGFFSWRDYGAFVGIEFYQSDIIRFNPKDERPPVGEYWRSRGPSSFDVSGFISSKPAGERLLRMVKYILETDEPKTWLDYREHEHNWIQFKFSAEEFDVEKLDKMARANDDIITEQIVRQCVKERKQED